MVDTMKKAAFGVSRAFLLVLVASPSQAWSHGGFHGQGFMAMVSVVLVPTALASVVRAS
jgi:hypothetical protein